MNSTLISLTLRTLLGRRRAIFLLLLPGLGIALGLAIALASDIGQNGTVEFLSSFIVATVVPLVGVVAGTGVIGPEIEDGSIVYVLAKPISRYSIVISKFVVAAGCAGVLGGASALITGVAMVGFDDGIAVSFMMGAFVAGVAYSAIFLLLGVVTRHAVVIGLAYTLIWEGLVGGLVPGAQALSVQEWSAALVDATSDHAIDPGVSAGAGIPLLLVVTAGAVGLAGHRLRSLTLSDAE